MGSPPLREAGVQRWGLISCQFFYYFRNVQALPVGFSLSIPSQSCGFRGVLSTTRLHFTQTGRPPRAPSYTA